MTTAPTATAATFESRFAIDVREPFAWEHSLRFICGFPATRDEQAVEGSVLVKAWRLPTQTVVARIRPAPDDRPALEVELASPREVTDEVRAVAADRIGFYLSVDDDLADFHRAARADRAFAPIAAKAFGYHQVKFGSPVENLVWAILAQRNPMPVAREVKSRLMTRLNDPVRAFGSTYLPFPSLEQLATLSRAELTELTRNERKAGYLHGTVQRLTEIDEDTLRHGDVDEVQQLLLSLPGIGPWSATFVMIRGLGRMELLPADGEITKAAERVYGPGVTPQRLAELAAPYAPVPGYWAHYLRAVA